MSAIDAASFQTALLSWYERAHRSLPWRVPPGSGARADPYRVWLSEIMLQQTVVKTVIPYFKTFMKRWPTVEALASASEGEVLSAWAGLGYYSRARNLVACAREVAARGGFPEENAELRQLPGIGPYTAAAIAAIAFDRPAVVVDGNIERVMARLFKIETPLPAAKAELSTHAASLTPAKKPGDYAQALMDLGATICRPRTPACARCPVQSFCAAQGDAPERLPVKSKKAAKPKRFGTAFVLTHGGDMLLTRRPKRGLLGGMSALPASDFGERPANDLKGAPVQANWQMLDSVVSHGFTHFDLSLSLAHADVSRRARPPGDWLSPDEALNAGLPTLFRKALAAALKEIEL